MSSNQNYQYVAPGTIEPTMGPPQMSHQHSAPVAQPVDPKSMYGGQPMYAQQPINPYGQPVYYEPMVVQQPVYMSVQPHYQQQNYQPAPQPHLQVLGQTSSVTAHCLTCDKKVKTKTNCQCSQKVWTWSILLCICCLFAGIPCCCIPCMIPGCYEYKHTCEICGSYIGNSMTGSMQQTY